ncbi:MAG: TIGR00268 family protein, partial [Deltaproteobacteria bacterium]|nr:TIGR00268 family protein [Deltaproteobacteria bacterium]
MSTLDGKIERLRGLLQEMKQVIVCFSGGVDSSYLLAESVRALGDNALALTAVSPSLAPEEGADAKSLAERLGARHLLIKTHEVDDPRYAANPFNRCYFCKTELYNVAVKEALNSGIPNVLDGFNLDDRGDHRPGRQAAKEHGVRSPLDELEFSKPDIREAARRIDLPVWDKPA